MSPGSGIAMLPETPMRSLPFRWLLAGRTATGFGSAIAPVALAFAVLELGGTASELGLVVATYAAAEVLTTLFGGVLGDRLSRTMLMRGSALLAMLTQAMVAASLVGGWSSLPLLAAAGGLNGVLLALSGPSSRALLPQTVAPAALPAAVSWQRLSTNAAMVLGFGVAGVLVTVVGPGWAIAVDAATFLVAAVCFAGIRVRPLPMPVAGSMLGDLRDGALEVWRHTWLWLLIGQALVYHLFYGGAQGVLGPIVVGRTEGEAAWGWALASLMAGFIAGGLVSLRLRPRRTLLVGTSLLTLTACFPLAMGLELGLTAVLLGAFLHGFGLELFSVAWDLSIQQNVAPDRLARVFAFDQVGSFVMRPLGLALTGAVAERVGEQRWLLVVAAVMLLSTLLALLSRSVRQLERVP